MRKLVTIVLVLVLGLLIPHFAAGYSILGGKLQYTIPQKPQYIVPQTSSEPCGGQDEIVIDNLNDLDPVGKLRAALTNYHEHPVLGVSTLNTARDRYELCFKFPNGPVDPSSTISIVHNQAADQTKGLAIYGDRDGDGDVLSLRGVNLPAGSPLLEVNFPNAPVALIELSMSDVINGLSVVGTQVEIVNATITGVVDGNGIELTGVNNSVVKGITISGCGVGISINNSNNILIGAESEQRYTDDKNIITNNDMGINVLDSNNVRFGYNQIYDNGIFYQNAIVIGNDPLETLFEPVLIKFKHPVTQQDFPVECPGDERRIKFDRGAGGTAQIYVIDNKGQALEYKATCEIDPQGYCDVTNLDGGCSEYPDACTIYDPTCNMPLRITAIITTDSSTELMKFEALEGPGEVIFADSEGVSMPSVPASGDAESAEEVDITSGAQASAEGAATEIAAVGAKGGCMGGGGASLIPNDISSTYAPSLGIWWIIFSIGLLGSLRYVRARRRK